jgi:SNF2 family DNA or RNA helicase
MGYEPKTSFFNHQRMALRAGWNKPGYGFLMEMGTGKSKVCIDNGAILYEYNSIECMLILAPKGVYNNWYVKEIPFHMPERILSSARMHLWTGGHSSKEKESLKSIMRPSKGLRILIMNTEAISASNNAYIVAEQFVTSGKCLLIVDEASTMKNPQAIRTKKVIKLARHCHYRRIATGSPVTRSPLDLWSQFEILYPNCLGYKSYYAFRSRFAVMEQKSFGPKKVDIVVGFRDVNHLSSLIAEHAFVVRKEDCLDLPPKMYEKRYVQLTDEQTRLYTELKSFAATEIEAGEFVSTHQVITMLLRLHQIVCGHVTSESGELHTIPTNRLDVLEEIVSEVSGKSIIWCQYRKDVDLVCERISKMGLRPVRYDGGTKTEERQQAIYRFQGELNGARCPEEAQADVFVGTPHAGGYGITLTAASTVIYYSCGYDLEKRLQSEDRAHRIGQEKSVLYVDLVAKGTVEEKIIQALQKKENLANLIMDGPARVRDLLLG